MERKTKRLFAIVPGYGSPHSDVKELVLRNNLRVIEQYPWESWEMVVCKYSSEESDPMPPDILQNPNVRLVEERGIVGQFLIKHAKPDILKERGYTHVLMVLDDVEMVMASWSWDSIFQWFDDMRADILAPSLCKGDPCAFPHMNTTPEARDVTLKMVPVCEFFCYIMPLESYKRYYPFLDNNNPWMWGMDLCLKKHMNLNVFLMNHVIARHYIKGASYADQKDVDPFQARDNYIKKIGTTYEEVGGQRAVEYFIMQHP